MTQEQALKQAKKLFGKEAIAVESTEEFRRQDSTGVVPVSVTKYIVGWEKNDVPTYEGIGLTWEEALDKAAKAKK